MPDTDVDNESPVENLDARSNARIERYKKARSEFFRSLDAFGGTLHTVEAARLLGITETALVDQVNEDRLIGIINSDEQEYLIPAFQFVGAEKLPHLEEILAYLGDVSDFAACSWFLNEPYEGFGRPAEVLRSGASDEQLKALRRDASLFLSPEAS